MKIKTLLLVQVTLLAGFIPGRAQNLIQNEGFENPVVQTLNILDIGILPGAETFAAPSTGITDWTVGSGSVSVVDSGNTITSDLGLLTAYEGSQYAVLNGLSVDGLGLVSVGGTGTLQQQFNTIANQTYQVTFAYTGLSISLLGGTAELQVNVAGSSNSTAPNSGLLNVTLNSWQTETFDFTATGTTSTLSFDEPTGSLVNADGVGLDDVSVTPVTPVPEPRQYAAAVVGFLLLLIVGRTIRRRQPGPGQAEFLPGSPERGPSSHRGL